MSLPIRQSTIFKRDIKRLRRQRVDLSKLTAVVTTLANQKPLRLQYRDHALVGNWKGYQEGRTPVFTLSLQPQRGMKKPSF